MNFKNDPQEFYRHRDMYAGWLRRRGDFHYSKKVFSLNYGSLVRVWLLRAPELETLMRCRVMDIDGHLSGEVVASWREPEGVYRGKEYDHFCSDWEKLKIGDIEDSDGCDFLKIRPDSLPLFMHLDFKSVEYEMLLKGEK